MLDTIWRNVHVTVERIGSSPEDPDDVRLQKSMLAATALMIASAAVVWGLIYVYFDEPLAGSIPLGYSALSFASLATFAITRRYGVFRVTQLLLLLAFAFLALDRPRRIRELQCSCALVFDLPPWRSFLRWTPRIGCVLPGLPWPPGRKRGDRTVHWPGKQPPVGGCDFVLRDEHGGGLRSHVCAALVFHRTEGRGVQAFA